MRQAEFVYIRELLVNEVTNKMGGGDLVRVYSLRFIA